MNKSLRPDNEAARVAVLKRYGILDVPSDALLDSLSQAAANLCETPIALISLVDSTRIWLKSCVGVSIKEATRDFSFCGHAILEPDALLEVEDASLDERFKTNPLVTGEPYLRFYAGNPLVTHDGFALGTLCVIDNKPRRLSDSQREGLAQLAKAIMELLRERLESRITAIDHIVEQTVQDGVMITDAGQADNPITYVNRAFELMTGYSKTEILGKNCRFLQGPDTDPDSVKELRDAIAEHRTCSVSFKNYRKDGTEFWNDLTVSPLKDADGKTVSFVSVLRNASDRFLAEDRSLKLSKTREEREQARASRNRLAQIVEDSSNEIYVCDADSFQLLNANRAARENLGYGIDESQRLMPWDFVEGLTQESMNELIAPLRAGVLDAQVFETVHRRKDGTTYPVATHFQYMGTQDPPVYTAIVQDISEHQRQEENVRLRERAIEAVDVGVTIIDATQDHNPLVYVNQTLCAMTGYTPDELIGQGAAILQKNNHQNLQHLEIKTAQARGESVHVLFKSTRKDGSHFMNDLSLSPVHNLAGKLTHYIGINRDVTTKLETEERSQRSRKIEAVGQLAGGVAHDFNNLLSIITGNLEFLAMDLTNQTHRDYLDKADSAAQMGARLTRRLLSFARQGQLEPTVLDANKHVLAAINLLRSTIGEHITLSSNLSEDLWCILADASEIENTVVNLVINARDAMPKGGTITIETSNIEVTENGADQAPGIPAGKYIKLSVSDTGSGMDDEVKSRVFEPFFTTKDSSTGLGLASIYGFAQQSGGDVRINSEVDEGAVIDVYLPSHCENRGIGDTDDKPGTLHANKRVSRILVVEDNDMVRELTVERLHALGYDTRQASDGAKAVQILQEDAAFDLILTDIVMEGGMSGFDVAQWVQSNLPRCKILLTSGFNEQMAEASDIDIGKLRVLQKPYSLAELQQRINDVSEKKSMDA